MPVGSPSAKATPSFEIRNQATVRPLREKRDAPQIRKARFRGDSTTPTQLTSTV